MQNLSQQRCFNHGGREAVARCPECRRFYCRECVTEHDGRLICAGCLKKLAAVPVLQKKFVLATARASVCICGFFIAWFFFYLISEMLLSMPSSFHEGTVWQTDWTDSE